MACLTGAGVGHVSVDSTGLWTGYESKTGTVVYVYLYRTTAAATARAHLLSAEEAAPAGRYLVQQPIGHYSGSPVDTVAACLGGHAIKHGSGGKPKGSLTF